MRALLRPCSSDLFAATQRIFREATRKIFGLRVNIPALHYPAIKLENF
jgi:hypothetical protein